jgi:hypothetical protein
MMKVRDEMLEGLRENSVSVVVKRFYPRIDGIQPAAYPVR